MSRHAVVALLLLSTPALAQPSGHHAVASADTWHRLVSILQYLQADYPLAVESQSEFELEEQRSFIAEALRAGNQLGPAGAPFVAKLESLQARIEKAADLFAWLQAGAHLYVCGDAARMAPDVHAALLSIIQTHGRLGPDAAEQCEIAVPVERVDRAFSIAPAEPDESVVGEMKSVHRHVRQPATIRVEAPCEERRERRLPASRWSGDSKDRPAVGRSKAPGPVEQLLERRRRAQSGSMTS